MEKINSITKITYEIKDYSAANKSSNTSSVAFTAKQEEPLSSKDLLSALQEIFENLDKSKPSSTDINEESIGELFDKKKKSNTDFLLNEITKILARHKKERQELERYIKKHTTIKHFSDTKVEVAFLNKKPDAAIYKLTNISTENATIQSTGMRMKTLSSTTTKTVKSVLFHYNKKLDELNKSSSIYEGIIKATQKRKSLLKEVGINIDSNNLLTFNEKLFQDKLINAPSEITNSMLGETGIINMFNDILNPVASSSSIGIFLDASR